MRALRHILDVKNRSLVIQLPNDFTADKVEVIILPFEEKSEEKTRANLRGKLNLTDTQYNEFHIDIKESRAGWEKSI